MIPVINAIQIILMANNSLYPQNNDQLESFRILWSPHTIEYCLDQVISIWVYFFFCKLWLYSV